MYPAPQDGIARNAFVIAEIAACLTASSLIRGHAGETDLLPADDPAEVIQKIGHGLDCALVDRLPVRAAEVLDR